VRGDAARLVARSRADGAAVIGRRAVAPALAAASEAWAEVKRTPSGAIVAERAPTMAYALGDARESAWEARQRLEKALELVDEVAATTRSLGRARRPGRPAPFADLRAALADAVELLGGVRPDVD
jgi:hypothetical protein